jgi:RNA polymerase sigma factor (sigma-70 family)
MSDMALPMRNTLGPPAPGRLSSDERLARLVARGDERAFVILYERHHQALYRYCRAIVRDEQEAEDALQSAMMRALAALRREQRDVAVRPWLFRIAHNEAVSLVRRRAVRPLAAPAAADVADLAPAPLDVEATVEQRERLAMLVTDLQTLGERQRAALVMRELSGLSMAEIAHALATSTGAAKQLLFEARGALHELAEGRAMECEAVRRAISEGDRRVWRGRRVSAHVRACPGCRAFQAAIASRRQALRALAPPLPALAAGTLLARVLAGAAHGGRAGSVGSGGAAAATTGAGVGVGGAQGGLALVAKVAAVAALAAGATVGATHLTSGAHRARARGHLARASRGAGTAPRGADGRVGVPALRSRGQRRAAAGAGHSERARRSASARRSHGRTGAAAPAPSTPTPAQSGSGAGSRGPAASAPRSGGRPAPRPGTRRGSGRAGANTGGAGQRSGRRPAAGRRPAQPRRVQAHAPARARGGPPAAQSAPHGGGAEGGAATPGEGRGRGGTARGSG